MKSLESQDAATINGREEEQIRPKQQRANQFIMSKILECEKDPDVNGNYGYPMVQTWLKRNYG